MKIKRENKSRIPIFRERFIQLRGDRTQADFAKFIGISRPTIGFYESGERLPDAVALTKIATKCEVSIDWLLGISDTKSTDKNVKMICEATGLSEQSVNMFLTAVEEKKIYSEAKIHFRYKKNKYLWLDFLNLFFEELNYHSKFRDLSINLLNIDMTFDSEDAHKKILETASDKNFEKIFSQSILLGGDSYQHYLHSQICDQFKSIIKSICLNVDTRDDDYTRWSKEHEKSNREFFEKIGHTITKDMKTSIVLTKRVERFEIWLGKEKKIRYSDLLPLERDELFDFWIENVETKFDEESGDIIAQHNKTTE